MRLKRPCPADSSEDGPFSIIGYRRIARAKKPALSSPAREKQRDELAAYHYLPREVQRLDISDGPEPEYEELEAEKAWVFDVPKWRAPMPFEAPVVVKKTTSEGIADSFEVPKNVAVSVAVEEKPLKAIDEPLKLSKDTEAPILPADIPVDVQKSSEVTSLAGYDNATTTVVTVKVNENQSLIVHPDVILGRLHPAVKSVKLHSAVDAIFEALKLKAVKQLVHAQALEHTIHVDIIHIPGGIATGLLSPCPDMFQDAFPFGSSVLQARYPTWEHCRPNFRTLDLAIVKWCDEADASSEVSKYQAMWCHRAYRVVKAQASPKVITDVVLYRGPPSVRTVFLLSLFFRYLINTPRFGYGSESVTEMCPRTTKHTSLVLKKDTQVLSRPFQFREGKTASSYFGSRHAASAAMNPRTHELRVLVVKKRAETASPVSDFREYVSSPRFGSINLGQSILKPRTPVLRSQAIIKTPAVHSLRSFFHQDEIRIAFFGSGDLHSWALKLSSLQLGPKDLGDVIIHLPDLSPHALPEFPLLTWYPPTDIKPPATPSVIPVSTANEASIPAPSQPQPAPVQLPVLPFNHFNTGWTDWSWFQGVKCLHYHGYRYCGSCGRDTGLERKRRNTYDVKCIGEKEVEDQTMLDVDEGGDVCMSM